MRIAGIDPGVEGAIAFADVTSDGFSRISVYDMPLTLDIDKDYEAKNPKRQPDELQIFDIFASEKPDMLVLEHVEGRPTDGAASSFRFGMGFGATRSAARIYFRSVGRPCSTHLVRPATWKPRLGLNGTGKAGSLDLARSLFPALRSDLNLKKHDGRAEALLIIEYYRRVLMPAGSDGIDVC